MIRTCRDITLRLGAKLAGLNVTSFHRMVFSTMSIQMVMMLFTTIVSILLSRALGLEGRGVVSWMMAFSNFGAIFVVMGLGSALKKYIVKMPEKSSDLIVFALFAIAFGLVFFLPAFYFGGLEIPIANSHPELFECALLMIPFLAFSNVFNEVLIGSGKGLHFNILYIIEKSINICLNIAILLTGFITPMAVLAAYAWAVFCRVVVGTKFMRPHVKKMPGRGEFRNSFRTMRQLIFSSYFSNLAMYFAGSWLTVALGLMASAKELGYFVVAKTLTDAALMFPTAMAAFVLPMLAKETMDAEKKRSIRHVLLLAVILVSVIALPMFLFPKMIIHILFGNEFMFAAECLPILAIGMIGAGITLVANPIIASFHQERRLIINSSILAVCVALLTLTFRNSLDALTAAYIYSFSYIVGMAISLVLLCARKPLAARA